MQPTLQIAVLDRGFVYIGQCSLSDTELVITDASCIRRWGTSAGLGQLALTGPTASTKLDKAGTVRAPLSSLVHRLDVNKAAWASLTQEVA
jgi:hypothetical protein